MGHPVRMRLFVAAPLPAPVLDHLDHALESVRGAIDPDDSRGPLRWTPSDQRHLTLAFYGEVPDGALDDLVAEIADVADRTAPFELCLRGAGAFDRRTLWVGCAGAVAELAALTADTVDVGRMVLGRGDDRVRSRAHVTVARVRGRERGRPTTRARTAGAGATADGARAAESRSGDVATLAHALAVYQGPSWLVEEMVVVASRLGAGPAGHPLHEVVATLPLRAVAG